MATNFLFAHWEYLAMFNYEVDPAVLAPHIPPFTEIDLYEGKAIVSIVGFLFNKTRVLGIAWPGYRNFEEVNLRYYIKYFDGKTWRRGVGFISEIVPKRLVATMANLFYNEHYSTAQMKHSVVSSEKEILVSYQWKKKDEAWNNLTVTANPTAETMKPNSEASFIFEHYYGYNRFNARTTIEYSLDHPSWEVYPVTDHSLTIDIASLYGADFVPFLQDQQPRSVFLARGSTVTVRMPRKIKG